MRCLLLITFALLLTPLAACGVPEPAEPLQPQPEPPALMPQPADAPAPEPVYQVVLPGGSIAVDAPYQMLPPPPRFYADMMLGLTANKNYGIIYPYIGGYVAGYGEQKELFGFCDRQGRVVCDPVYNAVSIISDGHNRAYLAQKRHETSPVYVLAALDGSWVRRYENMMMQNNSFADWLLIADDSRSWQTLGSQSYYAELMKSPFLTVCQNGKWGLVDYTGQEIWPCAYAHPLIYSEGLIAVLDDSGRQYHFFDIAGNIVLGPYQAPPEHNWETPAQYLPGFALDNMFFFNDRARYYQDGLWGFIDKTGKITVPPVYAHVSYYVAGVALLREAPREGDYLYVVDLAGKELMQLSAYSVSADGRGMFCAYSGQGEIYFNSKGQVLAPEQVKWHIGDNYYVRENGGYYDLLKGDAVILARYGADMYNIRYLGQNMFLRNNYQVVDASGREILHLDRRDIFADENFLYENHPHLYYDYADAEEYYSTTVYDFSGNKALAEKYDVIYNFDPYFAVKRGEYAGLIDRQGQWIIKVSLLPYLND